MILLIPRNKSIDQSNQSNQSINLSIPVPAPVGEASEALPVVLLLRHRHGLRRGELGPLARGVVPGETREKNGNNLI